MRSRSSRVLEHTILPSALVTTTPPQLQQGQGGGQGAGRGARQVRSAGRRVLRVSGLAEHMLCPSCLHLPTRNPHWQRAGHPPAACMPPTAAGHTAACLPACPSSSNSSSSGSSKQQPHQLWNSSSCPCRVPSLGGGGRKVEESSSTEGAAVPNSLWYLACRRADSRQQTAAFAVDRWVSGRGSRPLMQLLLLLPLLPFLHLLKWPGCLPFNPAQRTCAAEMESLTSCWSTWRQRTSALGSSSLRSACGTCAVQGQFNGRKKRMLRCQAAGRPARTAGRQWHWQRLHQQQCHRQNSQHPPTHPSPTPTHPPLPSRWTSRSVIRRL